VGDSAINPWGRGQPYQPLWGGGNPTNPRGGGSPLYPWERGHPYQPLWGGGSPITPVERKQTYQLLFLLPEGGFKIANESYFKVTKKNRKERHIRPETFTGAVLNILGHLINRLRDCFGPVILFPVDL
jgi:hypothetical protein